MTRSTSSPRAVITMMGTSDVGAQPPADLVAVDVGQPEVEQHEVDRVGRQRGGAGGDPCGRSSPHGAGP